MEGPLEMSPLSEDEFAEDCVLAQDLMSRLGSVLEAETAGTVSAGAQEDIQDSLSAVFEGGDERSQILDCQGMSPLEEEEEEDEEQEVLPVESEGVAAFNKADTILQVTRGVDAELTMAEPLPSPICREEHSEGREVDAVSAASVGDAEPDSEAESLVATSIGDEEEVPAYEDFLAQAMPVEVVPPSNVAEPVPLQRLGPRQKLLKSLLIDGDICKHIDMSYASLIDRCYVHLPLTSARRVRRHMNGGRELTGDGVRRPVSFIMKGGLGSSTASDVVLVDTPAVPSRPPSPPPLDSVYTTVPSPLVLLRAYCVQNRWVSFKSGYIVFDDDGVQYPASTPVPLREDPTSDHLINLSSIWLLVALRGRYHSVATSSFCATYGAKRISDNSFDEIMDFLDGTEDYCSLILDEATVIPQSYGVTISRIPSPSPVRIALTRTVVSSQPSLDHSILNVLPSRYPPPETPWEHYARMLKELQEAPLDETLRKQADDNFREFVHIERALATLVAERDALTFEETPLLQESARSVCRLRGPDVEKERVKSVEAYHEVVMKRNETIKAQLQQAGKEKKQKLDNGVTERELAIDPLARLLDRPLSLLVAR